MAKVAEIARLLDLTPRRVQMLARDGVIPKAERGEYDAPRCVIAYIRYLRKRAEGTGGLSLTDERTRLAKERADAASMENAARRGELVETAWVAETFGRIFASFRARILAMPAKLAPELAATTAIPRCKARLEEEAKGVLAELAFPTEEVLTRYVGGGTATAGPDDGDPGGVAASAGPHG